MLKTILMISGTIPVGRTIAVITQQVRKSTVGRTGIVGAVIKHAVPVLLLASFPDCFGPVDDLSYGIEWVSRNETDSLLWNTTIGHLPDGSRAGE